MDLGLAGQSFIVTGGSSGIGLATARTLLTEGALVTICGRSQERLAAAEDHLDSSQLTAVAADVLDPTQATSLVTTALEPAGRLDGVAALAGRGLHGTLLELDPADVAQEIADKVLGLLNIVKPALRSLMEVSGRIVALTAPTAATPDPAMGAVSAGRSALDNVVLSLAAQTAFAGVRVNAVGVGLIDTPRQRDRHAGADTADDYDSWLQQQAEQRSIPLRRAGTADEVAIAITFLLSPASSGPGPV